MMRSPVTSFFETVGFAAHRFLHVQRCARCTPAGSTCCDLETGTFPAIFRPGMQEVTDMRDLDFLLAVIVIILLAYQTKPSHRV